MKDNTEGVASMKEKKDNIDSILRQESAFSHSRREGGSAARRRAHVPPKRTPMVERSQESMDLFWDNVIRQSRGEEIVSQADNRIASIEFEQPSETKVKVVEDKVEVRPVTKKENQKQPDTTPASTPSRDKEPLKIPLSLELSEEMVFDKRQDVKFSEKSEKAESKKTESVPVKAKEQRKKPTSISVSEEVAIRKPKVDTVASEKTLNVALQDRKERAAKPASKTSDSVKTLTKEHKVIGEAASSADTKKVQHEEKVVPDVFSKDHFVQEEVKVEEPKVAPKPQAPKRPRPTVHLEPVHIDWLKWSPTDGIYDPEVEAEKVEKAKEAAEIAQKEADAAKWQAEEAERLQKELLAKEKQFSRPVVEGVEPEVSHQKSEEKQEQVSAVLPEDKAVRDLVSRRSESFKKESTKKPAVNIPSSKGIVTVERDVVVRMDIEPLYDGRRLFEEEGINPFSEKKTEVVEEVIPEAVAEEEVLELIVPEPEEKEEEIIDFIVEEVAEAEEAEEAEDKGTEAEEEAEELFEEEAEEIDFTDLFEEVAEAEEAEEAEDKGTEAEEEAEELFEEEAEEIDFSDLFEEVAEAEEAEEAEDKGTEAEEEAEELFEEEAEEIDFSDLFEEVAEAEEAAPTDRDSLSYKSGMRMEEPGVPAFESTFLSEDPFAEVLEKPVDFNITPPTVAGLASVTAEDLVSEIKQDMTIPTQEDSQGIVTLWDEEEKAEGFDFNLSLESDVRQMAAMDAFFEMSDDEDEIPSVFAKRSFNNSQSAEPSEVTTPSVGEFEEITEISLDIAQENEMVDEAFTESKDMPVDEFDLFETETLAEQDNGAAEAEAMAWDDLFETVEGSEEDLFETVDDFKDDLFVEEEVTEEDDWASIFEEEEGLDDKDNDFWNSQRTSEESIEAEKKVSAPQKKPLWNPPMRGKK